MKNKILFILVLLVSVKTNAQYLVSTSKEVYSELIGATPLNYLASENGYYVASNFVFPVFNREADFNEDLSVPSNGAFLSSEGYLAVYEKPGYLNTIVFQCLQHDSLRAVIGTTFVSAKLEGVSPNRISKFEWKGLVKGSNPNEKTNFQVWLHESDSSISYHYGPNSFLNSAQQVKCGIIVLNNSFTALVDEINLEGSPTKPAIYRGITSLLLPTLDTVPMQSTVYTFHRSTSASSIKKPTTIDFSIYPNPTSAQFNIHFSNFTESLKIEIYNSLGLLVSKVSCGTSFQTLDFSNQTKGLYFVKVLENNIVIATKKLIFQ